MQVSISGRREENPRARPVITGNPRMGSSLFAVPFIAEMLTCHETGRQTHPPRPLVRVVPRSKSLPCSFPWGCLYHNRHEWVSWFTLRAASFLRRMHGPGTEAFVQPTFGSLPSELSPSRRYPLETGRSGSIRSCGGTGCCSMRSQLWLRESYQVRRS